MADRDFEASVGISHGVKVFAQAGRVVVSSGVVRLLDRAGGVIAESPVGEASAKVHRLGGGCYLTLAGTTYYLRFNIGVGARGAAALIAFRQRAKSGRMLQALLGGETERP